MDAKQGFRPVVLVILDGWGCAEGCPSPPGHDAIVDAETPNLDGWFARYPHSLLRASGEDVGLKPGQMGDSNVGHLNLGAGRIVHQDIVRIDRAIASGEMGAHPVIQEMTRRTAARGATLHLMGLLSDGGVHSHIDHLLALVKYARAAGVRRLRVHAFLDGRDVPPKSAAAYLERLDGALQAPAGGGVGGALAGADYRLATVSGRHYAMDRDRRWNRTEQAYLAVRGLSGESAADWAAALGQAYRRGETDEFVRPTIVGPAEPVLDGDAVFFYNFRAERARQLTEAFALGAGSFRAFGRPLPLPSVRFASMTCYDAALGVPVVLEPLHLRNTLGEVASVAGLRQLRLAETEKYAHVTFFFSGGREQPYPGEDRILVPSPRVATYDLKPEMSAPEVSARAVGALASGDYGLIVMNYANGDMVGHTGLYGAALKAVQAVDRGLGTVVQAATSAPRNGAVLVVADHGNAEEMYDLAGRCPHTAHTTNRVPALLIAPGLQAGSALRDGILADVALTVLDLLGLPAPPEMTGRSLLRP
jgi:2,3-bisphosphoglycerate-independent phosphoglycerate mutase